MQIFCRHSTKAVGARNSLYVASANFEFIIAMQYRGSSVFHSEWVEVSSSLEDRKRERKREKLYYHCSAFGHLMKMGNKKSAGNGCDSLQASSQTDFENKS